MTPALLALLLAQSAPAEAPAQPDLLRIRRALEAPAPTLPLSGPIERDGPVFRMRIEAFDLEAAWKDRSVVPPYVRPWFRAYHHEHLEQVTPEEFRGATLHPYGLPIDLIVGYVVKEFKEARRRSQRKRAADEVRKALEAFLACRSDSAKPGCTRH